MANQLATTFIMVLLWVFEIIPVEVKLGLIQRTLSFPTQQLCVCMCTCLRYCVPIWCQIVDPRPLSVVTHHLTCYQSR